GLCLNPNVYGTIVIGLEPRTTNELVSLVSATGRPVASVDIQLAGGTIEAVAAGTRLAAQMVREASRVARSEHSISQLRVAVECGGSDATSGLGSNPSIGAASDLIVGAGGCVMISETSEFFGAEHLFAKRATKPEVGAAFLKVVRTLEAEIVSTGI